jgi:hypothetical protein
LTAGVVVFGPGRAVLFVVGADVEPVLSITKDGGHTADGGLEAVTVAVPSPGDTSLLELALNTVKGQAPPKEAMVVAPCLTVVRRFSGCI